MTIAILILLVAAAGIGYLVLGVQKTKKNKSGIYADEAKCPYPHDEVGYETAPPAPAVVIEPKKKTAKKPAAKKPAAKKPNSSQKKK